MDMKIPIIILLATMLFGVLIFGYIFYFSFIQTESIYKTILRADVDLMEISIDSQMADSYYEEASYAYEDEDYNEVERNCRLAREYYSEESQGYKRVKAELNEKEIKDELIFLYVDQLELLSEIAINMFEACEHFESAARYYDKYYNTDVPYDDMSFDIGNEEIKMMNEKIRDHDNAVERYNNKLEEFRVELNKKL